MVEFVEGVRSELGNEGPDLEDRRKIIRQYIEITACSSR